MFVEKLTLFGFKSFNQKTSIVFGKGISGVIGPNGCGKSNIVDALRWVLGEQSNKQLRGAKMEDVIFSGTHHEKPLSLAQVELTLSNDRGLLPIDYSTVTVGRRLYRSGHSEYLINGNEVRLKDVRDLFLDTGMGSHAYSVIERQMVDNILSDTTGHRRFLFEEAAGIMKYKTRRKEALGKLDATQRDLTRVNDIITEVERQVASLRRQVGKARRYKVLRESIRELDLSLSLLQRKAWMDRLQGLRGGWQTDSTVAREAETKVTGLEARLEKLQLAVMEEERKLVAAREMLAQVEDEVGRKNNQITAVRERIQAAGQKIKESGEMQVRLEDRIERNLADREAGKQRLDSLQDREVKEQKQLQTKDKERQETDVLFGEAQSNAEASRQECSRLLETRVRLEAQGTALDTRIRDLERRLQELKENATEVRSKHENLQNQASDLSREIASQHKAIEEIEETKQILDVEAVNHRNRVDIQRRELSHFRETEAAARSRLETLEELKENYEGFDAGARALVMSSEKHDGVIGTVSDIVTIPAKWIRALGPVLANVWQYVVTENTAVSRKLLHHLEADELGFATLIPLDRIPPSKAPEGSHLWASEMVETAPEHRDLVRYLLGGLMLTNDLDEAFRVVESGQAERAVSKTGKFVDRVTLAGGGDGPPGSDLLERQDGLARCRQEIDQVGQELSRLSQRERALALETQELESKRSALIEEEDAALSAMRELERKHHDREMAGRHLDEEESRLVLETDKAIMEIDTGKRELSKLNEQLGGLSREIGEAEELESTHAQGLVRSTAVRDSVLQELHEIRVEWTRLEGDLKDAHATMSRLEAEHQDLQDELSRSRREAAEAAERKTLLEQELVSLGDAVQELHVLREERAGTVGGLESEKAEAVAREHQDSDAVRKARRNANEARNRAHQAELELTQLRNDVEHLETRLREDYELQAEDLDGMSVSEPGERAEQELADLRDKMRRLGPVNQMALEEFEEKKTRFEFMTSQRDDLSAAKDVLVTTINEINKKASVMFMDTFTAVQENFQRTFQVLFQGGECTLGLIGEDPLEAEIAVMARPRGKKPQSISQLSSGERALTAIALLFSIYLVKPSPFCILDEVDAPLDDANIDRFVAMIKEFSKRTQFIMITHNKKTMEAADALYGVTMQRPGISSLVSVRLDGGNTPEAEAALEGALKAKDEIQDETVAHNPAPPLSTETTVA